MCGIRPQEVWFSSRGVITLFAVVVEIKQRRDHQSAQIARQLLHQIKATETP